MCEMKLSTALLNCSWPHESCSSSVFKFSPTYRKYEPEDSGLRQCSNFRHTLVTVRHCPLQSSLRSLYTMPSASSVAGSISGTLRFVMLSMTTRDSGWISSIVMNFPPFNSNLKSGNGRPLEIKFAPLLFWSWKSFHTESVFCFRPWFSRGRKFFFRPSDSS